MVYRPLPATTGCPSCGSTPVVRYRLFKGVRAECSCGVSGPFVAVGNWPDHDALLAWRDVAGEPVLPRPPAPAPMKR